MMLHKKMFYRQSEIVFLLHVVLFKVSCSLHCSVVSVVNPCPCVFEDSLFFASRLSSVCLTVSPSPIHAAFSFFPLPFFVLF